MARPDDRWFEATLEVDARDAEAAADALTMAGAAGVSIEPAIFIRDDADFAYDELTDRPWTIRAVFPEPFADAEQQAVRTAIEALALAAPVTSIRIAEVQPVDWAEEWKKFYRIQHVGSRLVVRPSWEEYEPREGEVVVSLDPGAAFGTGEHETTRLCLAALERNLIEGDSVLDVGAGSGILAVAAKILGSGNTRAIDIDPDTIEVARQNAAMNGVQDGITFAAGSVGPDWPWPEANPETGTAPRYDLVLANISSTVIGRLAPHLAAITTPGGMLIASGFILRDVEEVRTILRAQHLEEIDYETEGNWGCLSMRRL